MQHAPQLLAAGRQRADLDELVGRVHLAALRAAEAERGDARGERGVGVGRGGDELVGQARAPRARAARSRAAAGGGRAGRRGAGRAPRSRASSGGSTASIASARAKRVSSVSSSARCSITSSAWAAIALTAVPPWMQADVRAGVAARLAAERARDAADLVDRARAPAVGPGVAARAAHRDARAQAADARRRRRAGGRGPRARPPAPARSSSHAARAPARLPRPSSPTVNATASPAAPPLARELLDDVDGAHDRGRVVADAGPAQALALEPRLVRHVAREDRVDVREQEHARALVVEAPDQVAGGVDGRAARARRRGAAAARRCARPRRTSAPARAPARSGRRGHRPRRSRRADAIRPRGAPAGRRPCARGTPPRPRSPHRR